MVDEDTLIIGEVLDCVELVSISQGKVLHTYKSPNWCNYIEKVQDKFIAGFAGGHVELYEVLNSKIVKVITKQICKSNIISIAVMDD